MKIVLSSNPYRDHGLRAALEAKRIRLEPDFTGEQGEIEYFSCKITTHLFIIVVIVLWVLFRLKWPKED